jgi:hypothetical protein
MKRLLVFARSLSALLTVDMLVLPDVPTFLPSCPYF